MVSSPSQFEAQIFILYLRNHKSWRGYPLMDTICEPVLCIILWYSSTWHHTLFPTPPHNLLLDNHLQCFPSFQKINPFTREEHDFLSRFCM